MVLLMNKELKIEFFKLENILFYKTYFHGFSKSEL